MSRTPPFRRRDIEARKAELDKPAISATDWRDMLDGCGLSAGAKAALQNSVDEMLRVERLRRLADKQERPGAQAAAAAIPVRALADFIAALEAAPDYIGHKLVDLFDLGDIDDLHAALSRGHIMVGALMAEVKRGHNPAKDSEGLEWLAASVASALAQHGVRAIDAEGLTKEILRRAGFAHDCAKDNDAIEKGVGTALREAKWVGYQK